MTTASKSIAVIILNWNGFSDTCECIKSVLKSDYTNFKIVVVDNGSENNEADKIQDLFGSDIVVLKSKSNLGYCGGNNIGAEYAKEQNYDYFMVLNNDTIVDRELMSNLVNAIEIDRKIAAVNPVVYQYYNKKLIENTGLKFSLWHGIVTPINLNQREVADKHKLDVLSGTCFIFRSSVLNEIKFLFDQDFFCYYEDPDLSIRIKRAGYTIAVNHDARLWHKGLASAKKVSGFAEYQAIKNRFLMEKKNATFLQKIIFFLINTFSYLPFRTIKIAICHKDGDLRYFLRGFWAGIIILFGGKNIKYS